MGRTIFILLLLCCLKLADFSDPGCVIELECEECIPESMPLVTSHAARNGSVVAAHGDEVALSCGGGAFLLYPLRRVLSARCERGQLRVAHDGHLRHLLELGCQEDVFEDVLHDVEQCSAPLQGRSYQIQESEFGGGVRHLATVCFDEDRAVAVRARTTNAPNGPPSAPHSETRAPLSLLGNFAHMFDARTRTAAARLYGDDARTNRRLHEVLKHEKHCFAEQTLTAASLLSAGYFDDQHARVANFLSNKVAAWRSVVHGNLHHLQLDVSRLLRRSRSSGSRVDVYAGTHQVMSVRSANGDKEVWLQPGRFPVPRYIWTVVHDVTSRRALALVALNDPFVAVSEIRQRVFCESACGRASWLKELRRARRYEVPVYGLVFCCSAHNFTALVPELPAALLKDVPHTEAGMLFDAP